MHARLRRGRAEGKCLVLQNVAKSVVESIEKARGTLVPRAFCGGEEGTRTHDPFHVKEVLSQLS